MKQVRSLALAGAVCSAVVLSMGGVASAGSLMSLAPTADFAKSTSTSGTSNPHVIRIQKNGDEYSFSHTYSRNPRTTTRNLGRVDRSHQRKKKRYYNPGVWVGGNTYYDDRYYDDPYYDDPYYSQPSYNHAPSYGRLSCGQIVGMLRQRGYRRIQARDCTGKVYTFFAYSGHKRYKLRIRSKNGSFKTRKRI